jgi:cell division protein FtsN
MANRDYKQRSRHKRSNARSNSNRDGDGGTLKWMLITATLIGVVVFVVYLQGGGMKKFTLHQFLPNSSLNANVPTLKSSEKENPTEPNQSGLSPEAIETLEKPPEVNLTPEAMSELENAMPQFDFYTILPEKAVVVPDQEITARAREERINVNVPPADVVQPIDSTIDAPVASVAPVTKSTSTYIMQAGSFKDANDAEKMRTNLASMGIEARIERAKVGEVVWNRIKIGPYSQMSSVSSVRARLRQNGIDVIVTEIGGVR